MRERVRFQNRDAGHGVNEVSKKRPCSGINKAIMQTLSTDQPACGQRQHVFQIYVAITRPSTVTITSRSGGTVYPGTPGITHVRRKQ